MHVGSKDELAECEDEDAEYVVQPECDDEDTESNTEDQFSYNTEEEDAECEDPEEETTDDMEDADL